MSVIRAIEIGYGTTSYSQSIENGVPLIKTFSSNVALKNGSDLSGGLSHSNTIDIEIDGDFYEVGPDAHLLTDRTTSRALTSKYIDTPQYKALYKGALALMNEAVIDLLVLALPVNNMKRTDDLKRFAVGKHQVGNRTVTVKDVWVLCQPLAGFLSFARAIGQKGFNELSESNVLCLDFGYSTVDWLVTRGLKINYKKSGAVNMGMSTILESCVEHLAEVDAFKHLDDITFDLVDAAFFKHQGTLKVSGRAYQFPTHPDDSGVQFDCDSVIKQITSNCLQEVRNSVGAGADIEKIVVMGGGHQTYLSAIKENYPHHQIEIVSDPLTAVCQGMYFGGEQFYQLKHKQTQSTKQVA